MAAYLVQASYTAESWSALIKNPQDRSKAVAGAVRKLGGKIGKFYMSFGEYDIVGVIEMPDHVGAAAFAMAVSAGGACKSVKTTPLIDIADAVEAMSKAAACGYKPAS